MSTMSPAEFINLLKTGKLPERLMQRAQVDESPDVAEQLQATDKAASLKNDAAPLKASTSDVDAEKLFSIAERNVAPLDREMLLNEAVSMIFEVSGMPEANSDSQTIDVVRKIAERLTTIFKVGYSCALEDTSTQRLEADGFYRGGGVKTPEITLPFKLKTNGLTFDVKKGLGPIDVHCDVYTDSGRGFISNLSKDRARQLAQALITAAS